MNRVLQVVGGMNRAGAETMLMNIYRKIEKEEIQFDFLVYDEKTQDYENEIIEMGGRVFHIDAKPGVFMIKSVSIIKDIIEKHGPYSAIHIHTLYNSMFALLATYRYKDIVKITHSHSTNNTLSSNCLRRAYERFATIIIRKMSNKWYACGEEAGVYLFGEKFREKGHVINNGIDVEDFIKPYHAEVCCIREEFKVGQELIIGNVARLEKVKNHKFMIEFAEYLAKENIEFKMFFVGRGELYEELKKNISELKLEDRVVFLGVRTDIPVLLKFFDVFILPSFFEGNPVTLVEAQASGLPCIVSDTITDKMDVGLGLIERVSIDDNKEEWKEKVCEFNRKKVNVKKDIRAELIKKGYDVRQISEMLIRNYIGENR